MDNYPIDPIYDENSEILILGSHPGELSKRKGFYYVDGRNQFWDILSSIFNDENIKFECNEMKKEYLLKHHIALWDVCKEVDRNNSDDRTLEPISFNDLNDVLSNTKVKLILCNGGKAWKLFKKISEDIDIKEESKRVYSSSGAANRYKKERLKQWKKSLRKK